MSWKGSQVPQQLGGRRRSHDEKGNQGVGGFRISFHKYFRTFFYLFLFFQLLYFIIFFYTFFTHDIYPHPHPRPTTSTHYPRPTTFSYTPSAQPYAIGLEHPKWDQILLFLSVGLSLSYVCSYLRIIFLQISNIKLFGFPFGSCLIFFAGCKIIWPGGL